MVRHLTADASHWLVDLVLALFGGGGDFNGIRVHMCVYITDNKQQELHSAASVCNKCE